MLEPFHIVQQKRRSRSVGQHLYRTFQIEAAHCRGHHGRRGGGLFGALLVQRLGRSIHPDLTSPQMIETVVHCEPIEPRAEGGVATKS